MVFGRFGCGCSAQMVLKFDFGPTNCVVCTRYMGVLSTIEAGHQRFTIIIDSSTMVPQEQSTANTFTESVPWGLESEPSSGWGMSPFWYIGVYVFVLADSSLLFNWGSCVWLTISSRVGDLLYGRSSIATPLLTWASLYHIGWYRTVYNINSERKYWWKH